LPKPLPESLDPPQRLRILGTSGQHTDAPYAPGLLRLRRERPCYRGAAEPRDKRASLHRVSDHILRPMQTA